MNSYLKEIADLCGIKKNLTMHLARHTFATTVTLTKGISIESVSSMLGHTNIKTTQHYAKILKQKVAEEMNSLKAVYVRTTKVI
jgi:site-specific recombinase XerD